MSKQTPMMQQYLKIKAQYKDAFLFFRLGDFYEMFFEDAITAAQELEITLTKRDSSAEEPIPMCGVPYHSAEGYIKTLVDKGHKVAICEQVEDPKTAKGVVKREVVQLVTPGTVMESSMLDETYSNYIACVSQFGENEFTIVFHELSTGESQIIHIDNGFEQLVSQLAKYQVKEIVLSAMVHERYNNQLTGQLQFVTSIENELTFIGEFRHLYEDLNDEKSLEAFSRLLNYLSRTQKRSLDHLQKPEHIELKDYMALDLYAKRNLELTETMMKKEKYGSLLWVLDQTVTAMGTRTLKKWIERPLLHENQMNTRLTIVQSLYDHFMERSELKDSLKTVYDLERLVGRIAFGNANARDLIQLKQSLQAIPAIKEILALIEGKEIAALNKRITYPKDVVDLLEKSIVDEPPIGIKDGNIIKDGYNERLDDYRDASRNGKQWILELERKEKELTDIRSLKIGYNRVFGYYIEITHANKHLIPEGRYERKQTLTNAERYITPELKEKESLILEAEEKSISLEYDLFLEVRDAIKAYMEPIQQVAKVISETDVLQSFASVSEMYGYSRPTFDSKHIQIKNGRHPVIERVMKDENYVPNDVYMDQEKFVLLITGPNMSGKSTYMRQLALITIMAQIGCFVPAEFAKLSIVDQIFTRIGAADDLVSGQSTFMVEMLEANQAIKHATKDSLILFDEIGRGTSTFDGMALAQAIVEHIHDEIGAKTLFSTHYHELTDLEESLAHLKNIYVRAEEYDNEIVFLHKVEEGRANESYGIHVAKLADLPDSLITRASHILEDLEGNHANTSQAEETAREQLAFFDFGDENEEVKSAKQKLSKKESSILSQLESVNIMELTPLDAMNTLYTLQKEMKKGRRDS